MRRNVLPAFEHLIMLGIVPSWSYNNQVKRKKEEKKAALWLAQGRAICFSLFGLGAAPLQWRPGPAACVSLRPHQVTEMGLQSLRCDPEGV